MDFLEFVTAASSASAAASSASAAAAASELVDLQEQHAQEAWELEKSREAKILFERALEQAAARKQKELYERDKRWDYETEGIKGGIEKIKRYNDLQLKIKLLRWHKEGALRTEEEVNECLELIYETQLAIVNKGLAGIDLDSFDLTRISGRQGLASEINNAFSEVGLLSDEYDRFRIFFDDRMADLNKMFEAAGLVD